MKGPNESGHDDNEQSEEAIELVRGYSIAKSESSKIPGEGLQWADALFNPKYTGNLPLPSGIGGYGIVADHGAQTVTIQPYQFETIVNSDHPQKTLIRVGRQDLPKFLAVLDWKDDRNLTFGECRRILKIISGLFGPSGNNLNGGDIANYVGQFLNKESPYYETFHHSLDPKRFYTEQEVTLIIHRKDKRIQTGDSSNFVSSKLY